jgi:hypothetical protein
MPGQTIAGLPSRTPQISAQIIFNLEPRSDLLDHLVTVGIVY